MSKIYLDEDKNLQFNDIYLEEITEKTKIVEPSISETNQALEKLLEKLLDNKQSKSEVQNLGTITKDFMIDKFSGRSSNANQWMEIFNKECGRFQINDDKKKIEILKHFLECSGTEWYSCMLIKHTIESEWDTWEKNVCNTFANKEWSPIRYALAFKYQTGSLLEYALKKEKLLLEVRKSIYTGTLIDLIAFGLPNYVADKIDRETLQGTEDLYNEIGKLEHTVGKNRYEKKSIIHTDIKSKQTVEKNHAKSVLTRKKGTVTILRKISGLKRKTKKQFLKLSITLNWKLNLMRTKKTRGTTINKNQVTIK